MARPRRRRREQRDPWTNDPRDPLEVLARLVGRTAQAPGMGRGGVPMTDADITCALGYMPDKVGAALAMSVAGRSNAQLGYVARRAFKRVMRAIADAKNPPVDLHGGADRYRVRGVLVDVVEHMIWPERRRPMVEAAKQAKMRLGAYSALYRLVEGTMQGVLADARRDFRIRMWLDELERRAREARPGEATDLFGVLVLRTSEEPWRPLAVRTGPTIETIADDLQARGAGLALWGEIAQVLRELPPVPPRRRQQATLSFHGEPLLVLAVAW